MKYILQPALLAPPPPLEISEEEFRALKGARQVLNAAFAIEENFDLLIGNFLELETSALSLVASTMVRQVSEYGEMFELRANINRRAVNLLTAARLFVDHLPQRYRECDRDPGEVKTLLSAEYDAHFEYRFMEALRNHVQHSGLAVHSLGIASRWLPPGQRVWDEHYLTAVALRSYLAEGSNFKAKVLAECPDNVDLLASARRYIESLGTVQGHVRKNTADILAKARKSMTDAIDQYASFASASTLGLEARALLGEATGDRVAVFLEWDDIRKKLAERNGSMVNLSARTVVSAARKHGA